MIAAGSMELSSQPAELGGGRMEKEAGGKKNWVVNNNDRSRLFLLLLGQGQKEDFRE